MENTKVITSETMVTLYTWETESAAPQVRIVPLPFALKMYNAGFTRVRIVAENGEVIADSWE
jgi:hypothetical protein